MDKGENRMQSRKGTKDIRHENNRKVLIWKKFTKTAFNQTGFTLIEVLLVVFIIATLASIIIPKIGTSSVIARQNADIATGHQIKAALDRYQVENGRYPTSQEVTADEGNINSSVLIPKYISKLVRETTQQEAEEGKKGFGVSSLNNNYTIPDNVQTNLIMLYLTADGAAAEVRVYDSQLKEVLWSSGD